MIAKEGAENELDLEECCAKVGHLADSVLPLQLEEVEDPEGPRWRLGRAQASLLCSWFSCVLSTSEEHQLDIPLGENPRQNTH